MRLTLLPTNRKVCVVCRFRLFLAAHNILAELFTTLSKEEIQKVLDAHDGDVDAAGEELLQRVAQLPAAPVETPEQKRQREREEMISTLSLRFINLVLEMTNVGFQVFLETNASRR